MKISVIKLISLSLLLLSAAGFIYVYVNVKNTSRYNSLIDKYSKEYNIDPLLVRAIIKAESNFNPAAKSKKGAVGLMQLMPSTAKEVAEVYLNYGGLSEDKLYVPEINIMIGVYYVKILSAMFNNNVNLVLASYNAGLGNVKLWRRQNPFIEYDSDEMPFKETKKYVVRINKIYTILKIIKRMEKAVY